MTSLCLSSSLNVNGLLVIVSGEVPDRVQAGERGDGRKMTRNSGRDLMGIVSADPRQRVAGRARRGRRRVVPRRVAAANIARGKTPQQARRSAGQCAHHVRVRVRPGCQRPDGGVVVDLDEVSGALDAGTEEPVVYGSPACVRQNSTAASVASKWVATGGLPRVVGPGQLWPPLITVAWTKASVPW